MMLPEEVMLISTRNISGAVGVLAANTTVSMSFGNKCDAYTRAIATTKHAL